MATKRPGSASSFLSAADEKQMDQISSARPDSARSRPESARSRQAWGDGNGGGMSAAGFDRPSSAASFHAGPETAVIETDDFYGNSLKDDKNDEADLPRPETCWDKFKTGLKALWITKDNVEGDFKKNIDVYIKTTLKELVVYLLFLVILCVLVFGMTSSNMYYYTKIMSELFLDTQYSDTKNTFKGSTQITDFWRFAKEPLMDGLYWETWYNNRNISEDELGYIFYENKLLGVPRLRMLRIKANDGCSIDQVMKKQVTICYDTYSKGIEDTDPFGKMNESGWTYSSSDALDGSNHYGMVGTYGGGGFVKKLSSTKAKSLAIINDLKDNQWIDRSTRVVFIDFTVYNANINLFCVTRLILEFPATGGMLPSWSFRTVKLIRYVSASDYFVMACECIFILFVVYYIIEEILEIKKLKCAYFKSFWNILDILVLVISCVCISFSIYRTIAVGSKLESLLNTPNEFPDFEFLSYWQMQFNSAVAVAVFFSWIKVFKYISFNKTMTQLSSTLSRCAKDLLGFAVMFFLMFFAFAQLGVLMFGAVIRDFSTFWNAVFTLFRIILGDFDFHQLDSFHRYIGPLYFFSYIFFMFFILLNMFLAIINDTYSDVKADIALQKNEFEMMDYFKKGYNKMLDKLNVKKDKIVDIQKVLAEGDINKDNMLDFDEWRTELKSRGYADTEIEALFAKYDTDGDRVLDQSEQDKMKNELEGEAQQLDKEQGELEKEKEDMNVTSRRSKSRQIRGSRRGRKRGGKNANNGVSYEEFILLNRRVDRMEHSIGSIVSKIDAVLVKLEAMERAKMKRRETMAKILDSITEGEGDDDDDDGKREHMERLVKDELERWDTDMSLDGGSRGTSPAGKGFDSTSSTSTFSYNSFDDADSEIVKLYR